MPGKGPGKKPILGKKPTGIYAVRAKEQKRKIQEIIIDAKVEYATLAKGPNPSRKSLSEFIMNKLHEAGYTPDKLVDAGFTKAEFTKIYGMFAESAKRYFK